jgi:hypothetical protein
VVIADDNAAFVYIDLFLSPEGEGGIMTKLRKRNTKLYNKWQILLN